MLSVLWGKSRPDLRLTNIVVTEQETRNNRVLWSTLIGQLMKIQPVLNANPIVIGKQTCES